MKLKMDFISASVLNGKTKRKKIEFILKRIKEGSILVIDGVLKPEEEMELIEETMKRIDSRFSGIEVCSLKERGSGIKQFFEILLDGKERIESFFLGKLAGKASRASLRSGITLIGPAKIIKKIKKNPDSFSVLAELR